MSNHTSIFQIWYQNIFLQVIQNYTIILKLPKRPHTHYVITRGGPYLGKPGGLLIIINCILLYKLAMLLQVFLSWVVKFIRSMVLVWNTWFLWFKPYKYNHIYNDKASSSVCSLQLSRILLYEDCKWRI